MKLLQSVGAADGRQFPGGRNLVAAHAGELWNRWFEALLMDAEAEVPFEREGLVIDTFEPHRN